MSLRIAHVSTTGTFLPKYYGSNEYILCKGLAELGHEVTLFVADKPPKWQTVRREGFGKKIEECDGFMVRRLPAGPEIGIVPLIPNLFPTLLKMDFDIIHAHDFYAASSFYAALTSRVKETSFILTQHNDQLPTKAVNALLYLLHGKTLGRFLFFQARKIIALTTDIESHLLRMGADGNKISVIPNAIDTHVFSPNNKNLLETEWGISSPVILFVGRLVEEKGIKSLLYAFAEVVKKIPDANLVIVGRGPLEQELRQLQESLGLSNVFFLGTVETRFMPDVYVGCDLLVLPSIREPFGNVVIEAMASGKPVIGSCVGGIKDTIIHGVTGFHAQPDNVKQFSMYIIRLLEDKSLRKKMGENARRVALNNFDIGSVLKRIETVYNQCLIA